MKRWLRSVLLCQLFFQICYLNTWKQHFPCLHMKQSCLHEKLAINYLKYGSEVFPIEGATCERTCPTSCLLAFLASGKRFQESHSNTRQRQLHLVKVLPCLLFTCKVRYNLWWDANSGQFIRYDEMLNKCPQLCCPLRKLKREFCMIKS